MTLVVDASAVVAALVDDTAVGRWAEALPTADELAAPHRLPFELGISLRRASLRGEVGDEWPGDGVVGGTASSTTRPLSSESSDTP